MVARVILRTMRWCPGLLRVPVPQFAENLRLIPVLMLHDNGAESFGCGVLRAQGVASPDPERNRAIAASACAGASAGQPASTTTSTIFGMLDASSTTIICGLNPGQCSGS